MTLDDFKSRAESAAVPPGAAKGFDPVTLLILAAAISTAVGWLVTHCLDALTHADAKNPGTLLRARLRWSYVRPAVRAAIAARSDAHYVDAWQVEGLVTQALVDAAKGLTDEEFAGLKASAGSAGAWA